MLLKRYLLKDKLPLTITRSDAGMAATNYPIKFSRLYLEELKQQQSCSLALYQALNREAETEKNPHI